MDDQSSFEERPVRSNHHHPAWVGGAILILIGAYFLFRNVTGLSINNWWAIFVLIPAISAFGRAYSIYKADGRLSASARGSLIGGLVFIFAFIVFLFNLNFGTLWPVFLILGGVFLLINALLPE